MGARTGSPERRREAAREPGRARSPERAARASGPLHNVVACLDGSEAGSRVLLHAQAVARALGCRLTLLRVLEEDSPGEHAPADPIDWEIRHREAGAELEDLAARSSVPHTDAQLVHGRAAEQICRFAERGAVDLTVFSSHGVRGRTEWDLASTARKLADRAPGSILLVPDAPVEEPVRYRRILVPLDGSPRAESVLPLASRLAAEHGAELLLAHVVPRSQLTRIGPLDARDRELERRIRERNERVSRVYLDRMRARVSASARARALIVKQGDPRSRLLRLIEDERVDLVVLSAHGQGDRTETPCGSVAAHLLAHAVVPLLIVRERAPLPSAQRPTIDSQLRLPHLDAP